MATKHPDCPMTWRSSLVSHDYSDAIPVPLASRLRRPAMLAARFSVVTLLFLALPACRGPGPATESDSR